ncbi:MAG: hypothetical protein U1E02_09100 [Hydrogenophaga sp.]|nr:hypothetical protein [Burkholderiaceae bacterium]MDZ4124318.1 hypothetical protein [Hydrogenophaga sp.]
MKGEIIHGQRAVIYQEIPLPNGDRIVFADPEGDQWASLDLANHNVFRLDADNQVVWQVRRVETLGQLNWEVANRQAKEADPASEGYYDPFWNMGMKESEAASAEPRGQYRPGCIIYLTTRWWSYRLDADTGIATCTGDQVK